MKKRRTLIISLLLVAALCLGVGYAALSRELVINSTAILNPNNDNFNIVFMTGSASNSMASTTVTEGDKTVTYNVTGLSNYNDSVTLTYTVKNKTADVNARLTGISLTSGQMYLGEGTGNNADDEIADYFSKVVTFKLDSDPTKIYTYAAGTPVPNDFILAPGETATVSVTVTLLKTVQVDKVTLTGASVMLDFVSVEGI